MGVKKALEALREVEALSVGIHREWKQKFIGEENKITIDELKKIFEALDDDDGHNCIKGELINQLYCDNSNTKLRLGELESQLCGAKKKRLDTLEDRIENLEKYCLPQER